MMQVAVEASQKNGCWLFVRPVNLKLSPLWQNEGIRELGARSCEGSSLLSMQECWDGIVTSFEEK